MIHIVLHIHRKCKMQSGEKLNNTIMEITTVFNNGDNDYIPDDSLSANPRQNLKLLTFVTQINSPALECR